MSILGHTGDELRCAACRSPRFRLRHDIHIADPLRDDDLEAIPPEPSALKLYSAIPPCRHCGTDAGFTLNGHTVP